jgi:preprotein translocase SecF subunit
MRWPWIKYLPDKTNLRFVKYAPILGIVSLLACIASLYLTLVPFQPPCGGLNCGVDFTGGVTLEISTEPRELSQATVRQTVSDMGMGDVMVQQFGSPGKVMVKFETPEGQDAGVVAGKVRDRLSQVIGQASFSTNIVGPQVSGELLGKGVMALLLAIGLMLVFIWFRFGLTFGMSAIIALAHDVILTFGLFAVLQMEFTLTSIASVLTIIGYSINDKIVVLDRVRENLRKYKRIPLGDVIDTSINETLSRTIITGVTGMMALTVLAFYGGEALFAFAVSMVFGIVVGTYSSIYVAAPILQRLGVRRDQSAPKGEAAQEG